MKNFTQSYKDLNNSFKKKCVFSVGHSAGFFSEINNMLFAILYCLDNKIKFVPYFKEANFANTEGWNEFFEPFCEEFDYKISPSLNHRIKKAVHKNIIFKLIAGIFKHKHRISYLTYEVFPRILELEFWNKHFEIEQLDINGSLHDAASKLAKMIWRFNKETEDNVNQIVKSLNLPEKYIAIHTRGGDKIIEVKKNCTLISVHSFMNDVKVRSDLKNIFVFADDYRDIEKLKNEYKEYNFYTLCQETERGYFNSEFQSLDWEQKRGNLLKLFANIEICRNSEHFFGTVQANPDFFIQVLMNKPQINFVTNLHLTS